MPAILATGSCPPFCSRLFNPTQRRFSELTVHRRAASQLPSPMPPPCDPRGTAFARLGAPSWRVFFVATTGGHEWACCFIICRAVGSCQQFGLSCFRRPYGAAGNNLPRSPHSPPPPSLCMSTPVVHPLDPLLPPPPPRPRFFFPVAFYTRTPRYARARGRDSWCRSESFPLRSLPPPCRPLAPRPLWPARRVACWPSSGTGSAGAAVLLRGCPSSASASQRRRPPLVREQLPARRCCCG